MPVCHLFSAVRRWPTPFASAFLFACGSCTMLAPGPPVAPVVPHTRELHGEVFVDPYHWMRDRNDPRVINYLEAENRYTQRAMKHTVGLQKVVYQEMKGRIKETDDTAPVKEDDYFSYTRTFEGLQYPVHCRKKGSLDAEEEVLLDENRLAAGHKFFSLGAFETSPDHKLLAYSVNTTGDEVYTLHFKDLQTGGLLLDEIPNTYYAVAWANDNRTVFYNVLDAAKRPFAIHRHSLGTDAANDVLVYHEKDERFFVDVDRARSRRFILMQCNSQVTSEVHYLDADTPDGAFQILAPRQQGVEYEIEHQGDSFYIVTNEQAVNFKVMRAPVSNIARTSWTEFLPHRPEVMVEGIDGFRGFLAVYERAEGLRRLRIIDPAGAGGHYVAFPEPVYTFFPVGNAEFDTDRIRFSYASLTTPRSVFDYDVKTRSRELKKRDEVLGGFDADQYQSERIRATAPDGTKVPISLVYRKGTVRNGRNPLVLNGYGAYGSPREPGFSSDRISLLDRGVIFAIAHIRGGGDLGRPWYESGKLLKKRNTFTDFVACAEHLIAKGYTAPDRLVITGGSAGGLLMGAVTNMRPDLFRAVVADVPFVDVINTMLDPTIPLTVIEYEEWGNPSERSHFDYMRGYSPYDNVAAKAYPDMLITAGLSDPRVPYWEPAKLAARLRALKTDRNRLLLKTNMGAGHGGASGRYDALRETAFEYAFILDSLDIRR